MRAWRPDLGAELAKLCDAPVNVTMPIEVVGLPRLTLSRGRVAFKEGEVMAGNGDGEFVSREANPPVNQALSAWKDLTAPRKVKRTGIPAGV